MTDTRSQTPSGETDPAPSPTPRKSLLQLPGVAAISLYLALLAVVIVIGVVNGGHYPPVFLLFSILLLAASSGLMLLFRWAWALALAAVFLLACYDLWIFATQHEGPILVQGLLNMIFFLYLIRPEIREKLR